MKHLRTTQAQTRGQPYRATNAPFFGGLFIQPKLTVNASGDIYEREADAMADKVMRGPEPSQRQAHNISTPSIIPVQRKCAACEDEELQRKEDSGELYNPANLSAQISLSKGGGSGLPSSTLARMNSSFGVDFSPVKIHTEGESAGMNKSIQAKAFTHGHDIYFNENQYHPESSEGQRLLAHELTHVVQQSKGTISNRIQRDTEVTVTAPTAPGSCSLEHHRKIAPAVSTAQNWMTRSMNALTAYLGNPASYVHVQSALTRHFRSSTSQTATRVRNILTRINTDIVNRPDLNVECHTASDLICGATDAYVNGDLLVFCPTYYGRSLDWRAGYLIHEMAHTLTGITHITDRAYHANRAYNFLTPDEALTNADGYWRLCEEIGLGRALPGTAPNDSMNDCSSTRTDQMRRSMASVERWNRNAQTKCNSREPAELAAWSDLQTRHLGGTSTRHIDQAKEVYDRAYRRLQSAISFECENSCDSGVSGYYRYFLFITSDTLHVCPMIFGLATEDRTVELYKLILLRYGDVSEARAAQLTFLARALNNRYWSSPGTLTGFD